MVDQITSIRDDHSRNGSLVPDWLLLSLSVLLQVALALCFGHAYDTRIFMATGYLVGTGQNPYVAQDLSAIFHNSAFQGLTTLGYPPPWSFVLGLAYDLSYRIIPNFLLYNLAIKVPIIAANVCIAFLVAHILNRLGVPENRLRSAWIFLLFNPFLLLTSSAWGQFDPVVALLCLLSLYLMSQGRLTGPAMLLALAISLKPTAIPLLLVVFAYLAGRSLRRTGIYFAVFTFGMALFCIAPFILLKWDPSQILTHWNYQFTQGGGLSFMTFLEYKEWSYQLPSRWWFLGWLWAPALGMAALSLKSGIIDLSELLTKSAGLILVFFLSRAWLAEPNINLVLPFVLILTSMNKLDRVSLTGVWVISLAFSFFNSDLAQLFFPSMPALMDQFIKWLIEYSSARYAIRSVIVVSWLLAGSAIAFQCLRTNSSPQRGIRPQAK
ncbi:MAG TPA: glycosyltransferase 87 family protein [Anaerolineales bacterium]